MIFFDLKDFDIKSIGILNHISFDEQEMISNNLSCIHFKKNQSIYETGTRLRGIYYVKKGVIKLYKLGYKGKDQIFYFFKEGDIIGYDAVLCDELTNVCAKAIVDCKLIYIPAPVVLKMFRQNPTTRISILKSACKELSLTQSLMADITQKSNKQRVIEFLFDLKKIFDVDSQNLIDIPMKRSDLADHIGASREDVIRIISNLRKHQFITTNKKRIGILDINGLKKSCMTIQKSNVQICRHDKLNS